MKALRHLLALLGIAFLTQIVYRELRPLMDFASASGISATFALIAPIAYFVAGDFLD